MEDTNNEVATGNSNFTDIDAIDTVQACDMGAEIEIKNPFNQKPTGILIRVLGKDSTVFRNYVNEKKNTNRRRAADARRRGEGEIIQTAEEEELDEVEALTVCTLGWRTVSRDAKGEITAEEPNVYLKGEKLPYNTKNVIKVYSKSLVIRNQVDKGIAVIENFIQKSPTD